MNDPTKEQQAAESVVKAWADALTFAARSALSDHDLDALTSMVEAALRGDLAFLAQEPA